jgi:hypothetical protein
MPLDNLQSVKIDVNKLLQNYQIDCLFKQNCLVGKQHYLVTNKTHFGGGTKAQ